MRTGTCLMVSTLVALAAGCRKPPAPTAPSEAKKIRVLKGREGRVLCLAFSPDGKRLASGCDNHSVRVWDVESGEMIHAFSEPTELVDGVAFSPDGTMLAAASWDGKVRVWNVSEKKLARTLDWGSERVYAVAWRPDGKAVAAVAWRPDEKAITGLGGLKMWSATDWTEILSLDQRDFKSVLFQTVAFGRDGKTLAVGAGWRSGPCSGLILLDGAGHVQGRVYGGQSMFVAFSPTGDLLATGGPAGGMLLDSRDGHEIRPIRPGLSWTCFSPDGKILIDPRPEMIGLISVETGEERLRLTAGDLASFQGTPSALSPDERIFASLILYHQVEGDNRDYNGMDVGLWRLPE